MDQTSCSNFENVSSMGLLRSISEVDEIEEKTILTDSSHCSPHMFDKNFIEKLRSGDVTQLKSLFPRGSLENLMKLKKNRRKSKLGNVDPSIVHCETDKGLTSVSSLKLSSPETTFGNKGNDSSISQSLFSKEVQERRRKNLKRKISVDINFSPRNSSDSNNKRKGSLKNFKLKGSLFESSVDLSLDNDDNEGVISNSQLGPVFKRCQRTINTSVELDFSSSLNISTEKEGPKADTQNVHETRQFTSQMDITECCSSSRIKKNEKISENFLMNNTQFMELTCLADKTTYDIVGTKGSHECTSEVDSNSNKLEGSRESSVDLTVTNSAMSNSNSFIQTRSRKLKDIVAKERKCSVQLQLDLSQDSNLVGNEMSGSCDVSKLKASVSSKQNIKQSKVLKQESREIMQKSLSDIVLKKDEDRDTGTVGKCQKEREDSLDLSITDPALMSSDSFIQTRSRKFKKNLPKERKCSVQLHLNTTQDTNSFRNELCGTTGNNTSHFSHQEVNQSKMMEHVIIENMNNDSSGSVSLQNIKDHEEVVVKNMNQIEVEESVNISVTDPAMSTDTVITMRSRKSKEIMCNERKCSVQLQFDSSQDSNLEENEISGSCGISTLRTPQSSRDVINQSKVFENESFVTLNKHSSGSESLSLKTDNHHDEGSKDQCLEGDGSVILNVTDSPLMSTNSFVQMRSRKLKKIVAKERKCSVQLQLDLSQDSNLVDNEMCGSCNVSKLKSSVSSKQNIMQSKVLKNESRGIMQKSSLDIVLKKDEDRDTGTVGKCQKEKDDSVDLSITDPALMSSDSFIQTRSRKFKKNLSKERKCSVQLHLNSTQDTNSFRNELCVSTGNNTTPDFSHQKVNQSKMMEHVIIENVNNDSSGSVSLQNIKDHEEQVVKNINQTEAEESVNISVTNPAMSTDTVITMRTRKTNENMCNERNCSVQLQFDSSQESNLKENEMSGNCGIKTSKTPQSSRDVINQSKVFENESFVTLNKHSSGSGSLSLIKDNLHDEGSKDQCLEGEDSDILNVTDSPLMSTNSFVQMRSKELKEIVAKERKCSVQLQLDLSQDSNLVDNEMCGSCNVSKLKPSVSSKQNIKQNKVLKNESREIMQKSSSDILLKKDEDRDTGTVGKCQKEKEDSVDLSITDPPLMSSDSFIQSRSRKFKKNLSKERKCSLQLHLNTTQDTNSFRNEFGTTGNNTTSDFSHQKVNQSKMKEHIIIENMNNDSSGSVSLQNIKDHEEVVVKNINHTEAEESVNISVTDPATSTASVITMRSRKTNEVMCNERKCSVQLQFDSSQDSSLKENEMSGNCGIRTLKTPQSSRDVINQSKVFENESFVTLNKHSLGSESLSLKKHNHHDEGSKDQCLEGDDSDILNVTDSPLMSTNSFVQMRSRKLKEIVAKERKCSVQLQLDLSQDSNLVDNEMCGSCNVSKVKSSVSSKQNLKQSEVLKNESREIMQKSSSDIVLKKDEDRDTGTVGKCQKEKEDSVDLSITDPALMSSDSFIQTRSRKFKKNLSKERKCSVQLHLNSTQDTNSFRNELCVSTGNNTTPDFSHQKVNQSKVMEHVIIENMNNDSSGSVSLQNIKDHEEEVKNMNQTEAEESVNISVTDPAMSTDTVITMRTRKTNEIMCNERKCSVQLQFDSSQDSNLKENEMSGNCGIKTSKTPQSSRDVINQSKVFEIESFVTLNKHSSSSGSLSLKTDNHHDEGSKDQCLEGDGSVILNVTDSPLMSTNSFVQMRSRKLNKIVAKERKCSVQLQLGLSQDSNLVDNEMCGSCNVSKVKSSVSSKQNLKQSEVLKNESREIMQKSSSDIVLKKDEDRDTGTVGKCQKEKEDSVDLSITDPALMSSDSFIQTRSRKFKKNLSKERKCSLQLHLNTTQDTNSIRNELFGTTGNNTTPGFSHQKVNQSKMMEHVIIENMNNDSSGSVSLQNMKGHEEVVVKNMNQIEVEESVNISVTDPAMSTDTVITMRSRKSKEIMCNERKCSVQLQFDSSQDSNLKENEMSGSCGIRTLKTPQSSSDVINQSKLFENESFVTLKKHSSGSESLSLKKDNHHDEGSKDQCLEREDFVILNVTNSPLMSTNSFVQRRSRKFKVVSKKRKSSVQHHLNSTQGSNLVGIEISGTSGVSTLMSPNSYIENLNQPKEMEEESCEYLSIQSSGKEPPLIIKDKDHDVVESDEDKCELEKGDLVDLHVSDLATTSNNPIMSISKQILNESKVMEDKSFGTLKKGSSLMVCPFLRKDKDQDKVGTNDKNYKENEDSVDLCITNSRAMGSDSCNQTISRKFIHFQLNCVQSMQSQFNFGMFFAGSYIPKDNRSPPNEDLKEDFYRTPIKDQILSQPNGTARKVMQVEKSNRQKPEEKMKTAGNVFALPKHPVRLRNRNNSTENSASNSNSIEKLGRKNNKRSSTVDRTINELSFEETSLDVSEIPRDKTLVHKKKLIYHSTPVDPVIALRLRKRANNEKTTPYKTGNTEISNKKNVSVQVSETVSSSSSDAGTKLKQKDCEELSTSYSCLSRKRKSSNMSAEVVPEKRRYVTFAPNPTFSFDRSSDFKSDTNDNNSPNLKCQKKSVRFATGTMYFEQGTPIKDNSDVFSTGMSSENSDNLRDVQKAAKCSCCKSGAIKCSQSDVYDISVVNSDLNKDVTDSLLIEEPVSLVQNPSSEDSYNDPPPHSFRSLDQTSSIKLSASDKNDLRCLNEIQNVSNLSSTSSECTLFKNAKRAILNQRKRPLRKVEEKRRYVRRKIKNKENILDGEIYNPPELVRPSPWISDKLYTFLIMKLEARFGLEARVKSETVVSYLCGSVTTCCKMTKYEEIDKALLVLRNILFSYDICKTYLDFYSFILRYTPPDFQSKVIPLGGLFNSCKEMNDRKASDLIVTSSERLEMDFL